MVEQIKKAEKNYVDFNDKEIKEKTAEFKKLFEGLDFKKEEDSIKIKSILNDIRFDAFALVKRACTLLNGETFNLSD
jgi:preprotein translocase subunit SecA